MKRFLTILLVTVVSAGLNAQEPKISGAKLWKTLTEVTYEISKDEYGDVYLPVFSKEIQAVEGQEVEVDGYIIPFEGMFKPTQLILLRIWRARNSNGSYHEGANQVHYKTNKN